MTTTAPTFDSHRFDDVDATGRGSDFIAFLDRQAARIRDRGTNRADDLALAAGESVLDVGCGPGTWSFDFEERVGPSGRVVGVDFSEAMVREARSRAAERESRAEFETGDVRGLDLPDNTFDVTTCSLLLLHVDDVGAAVREMARVTKPGGRVCAVEPDHQMSAVEGTDQALTERVFRTHFQAVRSPRIGRRLHGLFLDAGLVDVRVEPRFIVVTDWDSFSTLLPVERVLASVVPTGVASEAEVRAVYDDLGMRGAAGRHYACLVTMHAVGTKPR